MGSKQSVFSEEQLKAYSENTVFSESELLHLYRRFKELDPDMIPDVMDEESAEDIRLNKFIIENMNELRENPFGSQICQVFSSDESGNLSFNDFVEMFNVFSPHAPKHIKIMYAFQLYDYDNDGFIGKKDLLKVLKSITNSKLTSAEYDCFMTNILKESDLDHDGRISMSEFLHMAYNDPDFGRTFVMRP